MQSTNSEQQTTTSQPSSSGKTSPGYSAPKITLSEPSLDCLPGKIVSYNHQGANGRTLVMCAAPKEQSRGGSSMPNISEWPHDAAVCLLSQVLERTSIPQRYFLSAKACAGILRRAEKRGRQLPPLLQTALERVMQQAVKITATGKAELVASETCSSHQENGRLRSSMYGREISELARDAELFTKLVSEHLKSITSQAGRNSLNSEQMFAISSCFVAAAISGFIPEQMRKGNSFTLNVTVSHGHTQVPYRGKPAADGPRYKAIGNSMAVPVMRWIGERIKLHLEDL